jgi:hypothetical protein
MATLASNVPSAARHKRTSIALSETMRAKGLRSSRSSSTRASAALGQLAGPLQRKVASAAADSGRQQSQASTPQNVETRREASVRDAGTGRSLRNVVVATSACGHARP